jgi:hypothetical protein
MSIEQFLASDKAGDLDAESLAALQEEYDARQYGVLSHEKSNNFFRSS